MQFKDILKSLRKEKKLTQAQLATELTSFTNNRLNVSVPIISYWENGRDPSINDLIDIASYFNVSLDYLMGNDTLKNRECSTLLSSEEISNISTLYGAEWVNLIISHFEREKTHILNQLLGDIQNPVVVESLFNVLCNIHEFYAFMQADTSSIVSTTIPVIVEKKNNADLASLIENIISNVSPERFSFLDAKLSAITDELKTVKYNYTTDLLNQMLEIIKE